MKELFTTIRTRLNQEMSELLPRYRKVRGMFFVNRDDGLYFTFSHSGTAFNYFICNVTSASGDEDACYNEMLTDLLDFIVRGTHIKIIKDPIKAICKYGLRVGMV